MILIPAIWASCRIIRDWFQPCKKADGFLVTEFINIFPHFLALKCVPFKNQCSTKKMFTKSLRKYFQGPGSRFAELHIKFDVGTLVMFIYHCKDCRTIPVYYKSLHNNWTEVLLADSVGMSVSVIFLLNGVIIVCTV